MFRLKLASYKKLQEAKDLLKFPEPRKHLNFGQNRSRSRFRALEVKQIKNTVNHVFLTYFAPKPAFDLFFDLV